MATGTQIRITETMAASFFKAGDGGYQPASEGQLLVFGVSVCLPPLSSVRSWSSVATLVRRVSDNNLLKFRLQQKECWTG